MSSVYEFDIPSEQAKVLEHFRKLLADVCGVTVQGNRVTIRSYMGAEMVDVHMIVEDITTPTEVREMNRKDEEMDKLFKKYPNLSGELAYASTGELPQ